MRDFCYSLPFSSCLLVSSHLSFLKSVSHPLQPLAVLACGSMFKAFKVTLNYEPTWPLEFPFEKGNVEEIH